MPRRILAAAVLLVVTLLAGDAAKGCSVPVFRYALEHWRADSYIVHVFHDGALSEEQTELVNALQPVGPDGSSVANLMVRTVDVSGDLDEPTALLWERQEAQSLPWMVVQAPGKMRAPPADVWAGEFLADVVSVLVDSPLRSEIADMLLEGESAVWVLLECGNADEDQAAFELLTAEVTRLEEILELPPVDPADVLDLSAAAAELKLSFAVVRLRHDDDRERMFREMLLSIEHDLRDPSLIGRPMAFPLFGRGRALYALIGDGIVPYTIEEACRSLVGACECTVKAENPGVDMVMAVEWDRLIEPAFALDETMPTLTGLGEFNPEPDELPTAAAETNGPDSVVAASDDDSQTAVTQTADATPEASVSTVRAVAADSRSARTADATSAGESRFARNTIFVIAALLAGIAAATCLVMGRR